MLKLKVELGEKPVAEAAKAQAANTLPGMPFQEAAMQSM